MNRLLFMGIFLFSWLSFNLFLKSLEPKNIEKFKKEKLKKADI